MFFLRLGQYRSSLQEDRSKHVRSGAVRARKSGRTLFGGELEKGEKREKREKRNERKGWRMGMLETRQKSNKAGYTANKQSLTGGQEQFADGQGQSFRGQGLYFGWAGAVMLRNHKVGQFRVVQNFL